MVRVFEIMLLACVAGTVAGCNAAEKEKPIWEDIKITDLAPQHSPDSGERGAFKAVNIDIYTLEIPAEKDELLNEIWQTMYPQPFRFNDYKTFKANLFAVGFGQNQLWEQIGNLLDSADAKTIRPVTLILFNGQYTDFTVKMLNKEQTIFYIAGEGATQAHTIGPGQLFLRIKAEQIPGFREVCMLSVQPSFSSFRRSRIPFLKGRKKMGELVFSPVGFRLKMIPLDFILFGPTKYIDNKITLASHLFVAEKKKPAVKIFLLVCNKIIY